MKSHSCSKYLKGYVLFEGKFDVASGSNRAGRMIFAAQFMGDDHAFNTFIQIRSNAKFCILVLLSLSHR